MDQWPISVKDKLKGLLPIELLQSPLSSHDVAAPVLVSGAVSAIISGYLSLPGPHGAALRLSDGVPPYLSQLSLRP